MTLRQAKRLMNHYDNQLWAEGWTIRRDSARTEQHLRWMCNEVQRWKADRKDKAMRWLGFVQGWMAAKGRYTIQELMAHSFKFTRSTP